MATIEELQVLITAETGRLKNELKAVSGDLDGVGKQAGLAGKSMEKFAAVTKVAAVAAGAAMAAGLTMAVKATASLEQSLGGSQVVFGEYASQIQASARKSFSSAGTSVNQFLETANKMGSLFQGAGFDVKTSMEMTEQAMQRATDVATAMGISTDMALESIAGAAKGNFTMMDNLGVKMTATSIEAYALSKGIDASYDSMTEAQKVGLAMQQFLESTAKYAGNYTKENETLSGSFTTLKASFGNFLSGVEGSGADLANALGQMTSVLAERLPEIASSLARNLTEMVSTLLASVDWGALYATIIPDEGIRNGITTVFQSLSGAVTSAWAVIKPVAEWFATYMWPVLKQVGDYVAKELKSAWDSISDSFKDIAPVLKVLGAIIGGVVVAALILLVGAIAAVITIVATVIDWVAKFINMLTNMASATVGALKRVGDAFVSAWNWIQGVWGGAPGWFGGLVNAIVSALIGIPGRFVAIFWDAASRIMGINWGDIGRNIIIGIGNGIAGMGGWLAEKAKAVVGAAKDALKGFLGIHSPSRVMRDEIGKMLGLGIAEGIDSSAKYAFNSMKGLSESLNTSINATSTLNAGNDLISGITKTNNIPVNVQLDGQTLLSFVIDGVNGKSFLSNDSVIFS